MIHQLPRRACLALLAPLVGAVLALAGCAQPSRSHGEPDAAASYLFCFWNVENLFDDRNDGRTGDGDKEYDPWFAEDAAARRQKLDHLSTVLLKLNDGRGPDILAMAEVESVRAAELLRQVLNDRLADPALHYQHLLMKELAAGRHVAPAILTRLPVVRDKTRLHGNRLRILEGHILVHGNDLVVIASHWTSRLRDGREQRAKYGDQIHGVYRAMSTRNPGVDFLVCGDFNDTPEDDSVVKHLHATGDRAGLLNLFAGRDADEFGTYYYRKWVIFDQIVVSPGLLDEQGWTCEADSARTINTQGRPRDKLRRPWGFGDRKAGPERGSSDHFPVTVQLKVRS